MAVVFGAAVAVGSDDYAVIGGNSGEDGETIGSFRRFGPGGLLEKKIRGEAMDNSIAELAARIYMFLLPLSWIAIAISVLVLTPFALFRRTRAKAGFGLYLASWVFGLTTWMLGATVTFVAYGWIGLLIGLFFFGVGVVPIGIFAAFFSLKSLSLGLSMIVMAVVVYVARGAGVALMEGSQDRVQA